MAGYERDEVPMLSDTHPQLSDENVHLQFETFMSRTRSASVSIPMDSMDSSFEREASLVSHTGPLRSRTKTPFLPMSGPLYNRRPDNIFRLTQAVPGQEEAVKPAGEKFPSTNVTNQNEGTDDNYAGKNEHLLRSGQLGMCNDPYCTTCPTYNLKAAQPQHSKASGIFDPKVFFFLYSEGFLFYIFTLLLPFMICSA